MKYLVKFVLRNFIINIWISKINIIVGVMLYKYSAVVAHVSSMFPKFIRSKKIL
jgi:hypothetical protein